MEHSLSSLTLDGSGGCDEIQLEINKALEKLYSEAPPKDSLKSRAVKILNDFGFTSEMQAQKLDDLSGGWRMRVSLAMAVLLEPQIILFDEPTNHLDLPGIVWLLSYLKTLSDVTWIIVSHDRYFLNETTDEIIVFQGQKLSYHSGNYDEYLEVQEEEKTNRARQREALDKKKAALVDSIQTGLVQAKKHSDDKNIAHIASKRKKLERVGLEKNASGHRFRLNRDRIGYFDAVRDGVRDEFADSFVRWNIPKPDILTQRTPIIEVDNISFGYSPLVTVLSNVSFCLEMGSKVAFVGANGRGKTTLMGLLAGQLDPSKGTIKRHSQAKIGYFQQHFVNQLQDCDDT